MKLSRSRANTKLRQYLPIREFDDVTNALNFDTADCHVVGGCDLYTTKAAGSDKKLYKNIEHSLESQYESLLRFSASLSPPQASSAAASLNLSRSSPFGSLSQISSRRTFAYLIATLNASHPDYDFSHLLRPSDFRREKSLRSIMNTLDTTLYNLRPRAGSAFSGPAHWSSSIVVPAPTTPVSQQWNPKMWQAIDKEMCLKECSIYSYAPEEDPYDGEEGAIWSFNYFFFHKNRKRVCYLYLRGLSIISHSPIERTPISAQRGARFEWPGIRDSGASKRARYWLGDRAEGDVTSAWDDDETPADADLSDEEERGQHRDLLGASEGASPCSGRSRSKSTMRGISEDIAELMEV